MAENSRAANPYIQNPGFFYEELNTIPEAFSHLLEHYSGVAPASQKSHILAVRNTAWQTNPYPCLGRFRFLNLDLSSYPLYSTYVLPTLKANQSVPDTSSRTSLQDNETNIAIDVGPIFLDLGTCLGQDLRKLLFDGVPVSRLYGSDIIPEYIEAGYALFKDSSSLSRSHFLCPADVFPPASPSTSEVTDKLAILHDKVDILHATAIFHLFNWSQQQELVRRCLRLLRKDTGAKVLVLGAQVGNVNGMETSDGKYRHNEDSWRRLWESVVYGEEEWTGKVKSLEVDSVIRKIERGEGAGYMAKERKDGTGTGTGTGTGLRSEVVEKDNQRWIGSGSDYEGIAKHLFWIWVEFNSE